MTDTTRGAGRRLVIQGMLAFLSRQFPFVIIAGCLLLLNWGTAIWVSHHTYQEREAAAFQMVNDEVKYAEQKVAGLFRDADRTLLAFRALYPGESQGVGAPRGDGPRLDLGGWTAVSRSGGIALIAPDGRVVAASPNASTAGWPRLMARLAGSADVLAIGEPVLGRTGHLEFIPMARRIVEPNGSFGGILMYSLESETLPGLSPAVTALDGSMALISDEGIILTRTPDVRGTAGIRITNPDRTPWVPISERRISRSVSSIDGIERIFAWHRMDGIPATLVVGIGYDATFADWETVRMVLIATRAAATVLVLLVGCFWYVRRHRLRLSADALTAIVAGVDHGIRVEAKNGEVIAVNDAGASLRPPDNAAARFEMRRPDGAVIDVVRQDFPGGGKVLIGTDVTAAERVEARVNFLTTHDTLTGLPNRWSAAARVQELIERRAGSSRMAALILLDLDGFQDINDTLGHEGGDDLLVEVARRLRGLAANGDVVARLGGDEFLLCLDDPDGEAAVMSLARQIPRAVARPITVHGRQVHLGLSMGIALWPRDAPDAATLFRAADIALSRAKLAGRGTARRFDPEMMASFEEHRMMESDLRHAIESGELELRLQPQFSCATLEVTGFEALTRWRHPTRGELSPAVFIPVAERSGLINPLGLWAIEQACKAAAGWRTRHRVAVNLSPLQLRGDSIQEDIRAILRRTQFPAHLLELEVTESVLLDEDQRTLEALHKLRALDIRITLDDFGAGYSSLSYLRRFPFDKIKIDKSFIQSGSVDRGTRVILEAMLRMCAELGFDVVAEGVETEQQLADLRRLGCREVQGFLLSEPLRPELVEGFLISHGRQPGPVQQKAVAPI